MKRVATLLVILLAGACSRAPLPEAGELRVIPLGGEVRVVDGDETTILEEASTFDAGVQLQTGIDGRAKVQLPGGPSLELAPEADVQLDEGASEINDGNVLVRTQGSDLTVRAGDTEVAASDAVFRLEKDYTVLLAVYSGEASLLGTGFPAVTALREMAVLAGGIPSGGATPITVDPRDLWDTEILGPAIDLGLQLAGLEKGLTRQLPARDQATAVSRALAGDFSPRSIETAIGSLDGAARAVVAAVVANRIAQLNGLSPIRALAEVVELYLKSTQQQWIVVAAQWGLAHVAAAVISEVGSIAATITRDVAPDPVPVSGSTSQNARGQTTSPRDTGSSGSGGPGSGNGDNPSSGNKETGPPPAPPAEGEDQGQTQGGCGNDAECIVEDVLSNGPGTPGPAVRLV
jgi:hypothetical protein